MKFETLRLSGIWLLIAGVLTALFAGWIEAGPLFWFVFALILIMAAVLWVNRINPTSVLDGLAKLTGYSTTTLLALALLVFGVPLLIQVTPAYVNSQWAPIVGTIQNQGGTELASVSDTVRNFLASAGTATSGNSSFSIETDGGGSIPNKASEEGAHIVSSGETFNEIADSYGIARDELKQLNPNINYDRIEVGQIINLDENTADQSENDSTTDETSSSEEPTTASVTNPTDGSVDNVPLASDELLVEPTASPTPSPTLIPTIPSFASEMLTIKQLKQEGERYEALLIVDAILSQYPTHPEALIYKTEIERADDLIFLWAGLHRAGKEKQEHVVATLSGYEFEIIESKNSLTKGLWAEESQIKSIQLGWTYGYTFWLKRGHVKHLTGNIHLSGTTFTVQ